MPWIKVDDHYDEHPKIVAVSPLGQSMWTAGLAYCNRNLTDGFIPWSVARSLQSYEFLDLPDENGRQRVMTISVTSGMHGDDVTCEYVIGLLVMAGLWTEVDNGYQVHDYEDYQPSKAEILVERRKWADRQAKSRGKSRRDSNGESRGESEVGHGSPVPVPVESFVSTRATPSIGLGDPPSVVDAQKGKH